MRTIIVEPIIHRNQKRIQLLFDYDSEIIKKVKAISGSRWSQTLKCWHLPYSRTAWSLLKKVCSDLDIDLVTGIDSNSKVHKEEERPDTFKSEKAKKQPALVSPEKHTEISNRTSVEYRHDKIKSGKIEKAVDKTGAFRIKSKDKKKVKDYKNYLELKRYSSSTIQIYTPLWDKFVAYWENTEKIIEKLTYEEIFQYITENTLNTSEAYTKQLISAIKFYYEKLLGREKMFFNLGSNYKIKQLPIQFDYAAIQKLIKSVDMKPGHELAVWLVFFLGLHSQDIASLSIDASKEVLSNRLCVDNQLVAQRIESLMDRQVNLGNNQIFLFEKKGQQFSPDEFRVYVWWVVSNYHLEAIYRKQFRNVLLQTDLSNATKQNYESLVLQFLRVLKFKNPRNVKPEQIKSFLSTYSQNHSASSHNAMVTALRFYYKYCFQIELLPIDLPRAKEGNKDPQVLSLEEITAIINAIDNKKHNLLISLIYSGGLRRSEVQKLKISDIDFDRKILFIREGKGRKDRFTLLSPSLEARIKEYIESYKPLHYLFEGEKPGSVYSFSSMSTVLKRAAQKAGIKKRVYLHLLRHSFGTHFIEDGFDTAFLQQLMGHNSLKTTQRYQHLASNSIRKVRSPFDKLNLK